MKHSKLLYHSATSLTPSVVEKELGNLTDFSRGWLASEGTAFLYKLGSHLAGIAANIVVLFLYYSGNSHIQLMSMSGTGEY